MAGPDVEKHKLLEIPAKYAHPFAWYKTKEEEENGLEPFPCMDEVKRDFDLKQARERFNDGVAYAATYHACSWGSTYLDSKEGEIVNLRPGWSFPEDDETVA